MNARVFCKIYFPQAFRNTSPPPRPWEDSRRKWQTLHMYTQGDSYRAEGNSGSLLRLSGYLPFDQITEALVIAPLWQRHVPAAECVAARCDYLVTQSYYTALPLNPFSWCYRSTWMVLLSHVSVQQKNRVNNLRMKSAIYPNESSGAFLHLVCITSLHLIHKKHKRVRIYSFADN